MFHYKWRLWLRLLLYCCCYCRFYCHSSFIIYLQFCYSLFNPQVEREVEQNILNLKVDLSDGSTGYIFSRNPQRNEAKMLTYNCHICSVPNLPGERCLYTHISGRRHQTKLTSKPFNANLFRAPIHRSKSKLFL